MRVPLLYYKTFFLAVMIFMISSALYAQEPDWNQYTDNKVRLRAMNDYGKLCVRKQQFAEAFHIFSKSTQFAEQAGLDSFRINGYTLMGSALSYQSKFDSALFFLQKAKTLATGTEYYGLQAAVQIQYYGFYLRTGKPDSMEIVVSRLLTMVPRLDSNSKERGVIELYAGQDAKHKTRYNDALRHFYKAVRIFDALHDSTNVAITYNSMAMTLAYVHQPESALNYYRKSAELLTRLGRKFELINAELNMSEQFFVLKLYDSSEVHARIALQLAEAADEKTFQSFAYMHLGDAYAQRREYRQAEKYFQQSLQLGKEDANQDMAGTYLGLGEMYMAEKKPALATPYLENFLSLAKEKNYAEQITEAYEDLAKNENDLHHYEKAFAYQKLLSAYKDSTYTESLARNTAEMESVYQTELKEKEIALLKKNQQLEQAELQKERTRKTAGFILAAMIALLGLLFVNRYRIIQKSRRLVEIERLRNHIARDLHDDIGSTLSSIHINSRLALNNMSDEKIVQGQLEKIQTYSGEMMEDMSDIVWTINPYNDSLEKMGIRMKEFASEMLDPLNMTLQFEETYDSGGGIVPVDRRKDIYLIFKETINNIAKYSQCTHVQVILAVSSRLLTLSVKDDGRGFNPVTDSSGNGIRNMRQRAAALGAQMEISSHPGRGTTLVLEVPVS